MPSPYWDDISAPAKGRYVYVEATFVYIYVCMYVCLYVWMYLCMCVYGYDIVDSTKYEKCQGKNQDDEC